MEKTARKALILTITAAAICGGAVAGMGISYALTPSPAAIKAAEETDSVEKFSVNENGQTYGLINQGLYSDPEARPQLIFVTTDEGKDGYSYYYELFPNANVDSPEEAEASSTDKPYEVPVFKVDGKTVIGFHTVNRTPEK